MDLADIDPALLSTLQELERQKRRMRNRSRVGALNRSLSDLFEKDPTSSPPKALARSRSLLDLPNSAKTPPKKCGDLSSGSDRSQLDSGRTTCRSFESLDGEQRRLQQDFLDRRAAWYKSCSASRSTKSQQLTLRVSCPARAPSPTARVRAGSDLTSHDGAKRRVSMSLIYGVPYTHVLRMLDCALVFLVGAVLYCSASVRW